MANESQFLIRGNFLVVKDFTTNDEFIREPVSSIKFTRTKDDRFYFFNVTPMLNNYGSQQLNQLGVNRIEDVSGAVNESRSFFEFSNSVDENGLPFADADAMDEWLSTNLGATIIVNGDGSGYLTYVATDQTLTGDGTLANPLSVLPDADLYEQKWDQLIPTIASAWNRIGTGFPDKLMTISIQSDVNNNQVGVRQAGTSLGRYYTLDRQSCNYWVVKADNLGNIEVYTDSLDAEIRIESILR
jgi:hypothetical protein